MSSSEQGEREMRRGFEAGVRAGHQYLSAYSDKDEDQDEHDGEGNSGEQHDNEKIRPMRGVQ